MLKKTFGKQKSCEECPYKLGFVKTLVNPCPQCPVGQGKGIRGSFDDVGFKGGNTKKKKCKLPIQNRDVGK